MATFLVVKHIGALRPIDEAGEDALRKVGQGEIVEIVLRRPRNGKFHRKFWALAALVWNQVQGEDYPTVEALVTRMKIAVGHRDELHFRDGLVAYIPRSISFAAMDDTEFSDFFDRCCDWVAGNVLPGVSQEDLRRELEEMIGAKVGG